MAKFLPKSDLIVRVFDPEYTDDVEGEDETRKNKNKLKGIKVILRVLKVMGQNHCDEGT